MPNDLIKKKNIIDITPRKISIIQRSYEIEIFPKAHIFRFENYWIHQPSFMECVQQVWQRQSQKSHISAVIMDKLKSLRFALKKWQKGFLTHLNISNSASLLPAVIMDKLKSLRFALKK